MLIQYIDDDETLINLRIFGEVCPHRHDLDRELDFVVMQRSSISHPLGDERPAEHELKLLHVNRLKPARTGCVRSILEIGPDITSW